MTIGINAYKHHPKLNNAVADAQAFGTVLTKRYGFEHLIDPLTDSLATQEAIFDALHHCRKLKTKDRLVIFFSGHDWYKTSTKLGFLVPVDGNRPVVLSLPLPPISPC